MKKMRRVLVVDDQINTLKVLMAILADEGYEVLRATSGAEALNLLESEENIHAILADLKMPGIDGMDFYRTMKTIREPIPFIIMTAYGSVKSAVQALKEGVTNYLIKPLDFDELIIILEKSIRQHEMAGEIKRLRLRINEETTFHGIIGCTRAMKDIFDMVLTVGPTDASILIHGETGTGKELLARAIHEESRRREGNLVCINSAALTESLLEAELFGYVRGAFTGASTNRKGRLEMAHRGTLFLDEIGHMSLRLQSKLLRFVQEMVFEPVGSTESRSVDVRLIAATNLNLQGEIKAGRFLSDLLYRIEVISIRMPPLRERREDIPLLAEYFLRHYAEQYQKALDGVNPEAMEVLMGYAWPGNVRELKNCMARAVILSKGGHLRAEDFPDKAPSAGRSAPTFGEKPGVLEIPEQGLKLRDMEIELVRRTLQKCGGNKSLAAQSLGISRKALYEKIERYGIAP
ncbi:MAG: sigma-54-dependent Fis family transcriptional regulator [Deltaproteobacteria bacterium]|nr:sigma-54-dependent Fis family transcriptional regulator [Deltaproteobacteria bacterium]